MSLLPFAPRTDCGEPRCGCNPPREARVIRLCRCHLGDAGPCPLHPVKRVPSRAQLLTVAVVCLLVAGVVLAMWMRGVAMEGVALP